MQPPTNRAPVWLWTLVFSMERDIPHRDIPGTFLIINLNTKYFNFILNNEISFQIMKFHSKYLFFISKHTFSFMFLRFFQLMISRIVVIFYLIDLICFCYKFSFFCFHVFYMYFSVFDFYFDCLLNFSDFLNFFECLLFFVFSFIFPFLKYWFLYVFFLEFVPFFLVFLAFLFFGIRFGMRGLFLSVVFWYIFEFLRIFQIFFLARTAAFRSSPLRSTPGLCNELARPCVSTSKPTGRRSGLANPYTATDVYEALAWERPWCDQCLRRAPASCWPPE